MQVPWPRRGMGRVASRPSGIPAHHDSPAHLATPPPDHGVQKPDGDVVEWRSGGARRLTKKRRHPLLDSSSQRLAESTPLPSTKRRAEDWNVGSPTAAEAVAPSHPPSARLPPAQTQNASPWCCRQTRQNLDLGSESRRMLRVRGEGVADCPRDGRGGVAHTKSRREGMACHTSYPLKTPGKQTRLYSAKA